MTGHQILSSSMENKLRKDRKINTKMYLSNCIELMAIKKNIRILRLNWIFQTKQHKRVFFPFKKRLILINLFIKWVILKTTFVYLSHICMGRSLATECLKFQKRHENFGLYPTTKILQRPFPWGQGKKNGSTKRVISVVFWCLKILGTSKNVISVVIWFG